MIYLIIVLIIEFLFKPRLDITIDKKILLWYGRSLKRNYIILFEP
jgi:hypothetical protein